MLRQRILTALLLGFILVLIVLYGHKLIFVAFLAFVILLGAWEWTRLCDIEKSATRLIYTLFMTGLFFVFYIFIDASLTSIVYVFGTIWWCIAAMLVIFFQKGNQVITGHRILNYLVGCCVLLPASLSLIYMFASENGRELVLLLFITIWVVDSAAYFTGSRWGKHRLANRVSPGKSWEGFIGSLVFSVIPAGIYFSAKGLTGIGFLWIFILFVVTALFSVIGDLFESMYKRHVNLKDSSQILPGHGGVLDRIDSLTAAAPVFVFGVRLLEGRI